MFDLWKFVAAEQGAWIPVLQKDTRARNTHSSTSIEGNPLTLKEVRAQSAARERLALRPLVKAGLVKRVGTSKSGRYILK